MALGGKKWETDVPLTRDSSILPGFEQTGTFSLRLLPCVLAELEGTGCP